MIGGLGLGWAGLGLAVDDGSLAAEKKTVIAVFGKESITEIKAVIGECPVLQMPACEEDRSYDGDESYRHRY